MKCAHRHNSTMLIARAQGKKSEGPDSGSPEVFKRSDLCSISDFCFPLPVLGTFLTLRSGTLGQTAAVQNQSESGA